MAINGAENQQFLENLGYRVLSHFLAGHGYPPVAIGEANECRFCGETSNRNIRNVAHSVPEGLGNHWITSNDECDRCNAFFSQYDDSLCKSVGAILSLGGTIGKGGRIRQTGRSKGASVISFDKEAGHSKIFYQASVPPVGKPSEIPLEISFFTGGEMKTVIPTPKESFVPRHAYKALAKIGLATLPAEKLTHFSKLRSWIMSDDESEDFSFLDVCISTGSLGKAPPLVAVTILERLPYLCDRPSHLLVVIVGSVCWQVDLMPDELDDSIGLLQFGKINIPWSVIAKDYETEPAPVSYGFPIHFDWSSNSSIEVPIAAVNNYFNEETNKGRVEVTWRQMVPV